MVDTVAVSKRQTRRAGPAAAKLGELDEGELVRRAQLGDAAAFGVLITTYQEVIYRLAVRTAGYEAAEDLAQVAFLKAWEALPRFAGDAAFSTWLYRIALNSCYDYLRRSAKQRFEPLDDLALAVPDQQDVAAQVIATAEDAERRAALVAALAKLPADERALLALRVGEGWSYEQIATTFAINSATVGTRLFRIRARLRQLVRQQLGVEGDDGE